MTRKTVLTSRFLDGVILRAFPRLARFGHGGVEFKNQSLRYANHQLTRPIGIVAAKAHHSGRLKSGDRAQCHKNGPENFPFHAQALGGHIHRTSRIFSHTGQSMRGQSEAEQTGLSQH